MRTPSDQSSCYTADVPEGLPFAHDATSLAGRSLLNLTCAAGDFDLVFLPAGTSGYLDLANGGVAITVGGEAAVAASIEDIVRSKRAAGRTKDLRALVVLNRILRDRSPT